MKFRTGLAVIVAALMLAPVAGATTIPYWWFTNAKANRAVVAKNFQLWAHPTHDPPSPHSTILKSACKGYGLAKRSATTRYYRHFICQTTWKYDTPDANYGSGPFKAPLLCDTTKAKPLGLKCQVSA